MEMLDGFAELVRRPESEVDLAEGALMIASGADPGLDPSAPLASLDEFAEVLGELGPARHEGGLVDGSPLRQPDEGSHCCADAFDGTGAGFHLLHVHPGR